MLPKRLKHFNKEFKFLRKIWRNLMLRIKSNPISFTELSATMDLQKMAIFTHSYMIEFKSAGLNLMITKSQKSMRV